MTNPTDELTALHELAKSCPGGVEACEWWPGCVRYYGGTEYALMIDAEGDYARIAITNQHALDLVRAAAERKLDANGWHLTRLAGESGYTYSAPGGVDKPQLKSLPEALAYAMENA